MNVVGIAQKMSHRFGDFSHQCPPYEGDRTLRALMSRRDPNGVKYNFPNTEEGREKTKGVIKRKIEGNL